jgi:hypothetical protein
MSKRSRSRPSLGEDAGSEEDIKTLKPTKKKVKTAEAVLRENDGDNSVFSTQDNRLPIKNGFRMMPVHIGESPFLKFWYFREQKSASQRPSGTSNESEDDADVPEDARSLFVTNIGSDCSENDIRSVFGVCGDIEAVRCVHSWLHAVKKPTNFCRFDSLHAHIEHPIQPKSPQASTSSANGPPRPSKGQEQLFQHRQVCVRPFHFLYCGQFNQAYRLSRPTPT